MVAYCFVYGVDGFGADIYPAFEEGIYLDKAKAFKRFKRLTKEALLCNPNRNFYESGWGEGSAPEKYQKQIDQWIDNGEWDEVKNLFDSHKLTKLKDICEAINSYETPPYGFYQMVKIKIIS